MRNVAIKVYSFEELSEEAQKAALQALHNINTDFEWWEDLDFKEIGDLFGLHINEVYFSGFYSQGSGACIEGRFEYKKGSLKAVKEYAPEDTELHEIVKNIVELQRKNFYRLNGSIRQLGHYNHSGCTAFSIQATNSECEEFSVSYDTEEEVKQAYRAFMDWIYSQLQKEHEYLTSEEAIKETIEINGYEFTENGELF